MLVRLPAEHRGHSRQSWLDSYHSFSFAEFYDPERLGVSALRVLNEDRVQPGAGFDTHGHRDMEIVTYVLDGELEHRDSLGHVGHLRAGQVQRMSAGTGIRHSEYNASATQPLHFVQIWVQPAQTGLTPSYQEAAVPGGAGLHWLAAGAAAGGAPLSLHQDARIGRIGGGGVFTLPLAAGRVGFLHMLSGSAGSADVGLRAGDGAVVFEQVDPQWRFGDDSEALWFDLPPLAVAG